MIDPSDPVIASLAQRFFEQQGQFNADRRGHFVAELAAFSFVIDKGLATFEQVIQRLQEVQKTLPADYQGPDVSERIELLSRVLAQVYGQKTHGWTPKVIQGGVDQNPASDPVLPKNER